MKLLAFVIMNYLGIFSLFFSWACYNCYRDNKLNKDARELANDCSAVLFLTSVICIIATQVMICFGWVH